MTFIMLLLLLRQQEQVGLEHLQALGPQLQQQEVITTTHQLSMQVVQTGTVSFFHSYA